MAAQNLQYGIRTPGYEQNFSYPVGASEVFKKKGGGYVTEDSSGRVETSQIATATTILGYALLNEDFTASSTEGGSVVTVNVDLDCIYELPINSGTYAATMRGKTCDFSISSNMQGAALGASSVDTLEIVDKGYTNAAGTVVSVLVKLFQKNLTRTGVV